MSNATPSGPGRNDPVERQSAKKAGLTKNTCGELVIKTRAGTKKNPIFTEKIVFPGDYIDDLEDK